MRGGLAVGLADDAAVAGRVVHHAGEQRGGVAALDVDVDELAQRLGAQQRCVARQHDDRRLVVVVVAAEGRHADRRGVAGAVLLDLLDEGDVGPAGRELLHLLGDLLGAVADDDDRAFGMHQLEGVDDVQDHGPPADEVQRLGAARPHPGAFSGGEHDC